MTTEKGTRKHDAVHDAATKLGTLGGKQTAKLHGKEQFPYMARIAHASKVKLYGKGFYTLIRFGFTPKKMTAAQREEAIAKIEMDKIEAERSRHQKQRTR